MSEASSNIVFPEHFGFCEGVNAADQLLTRVVDEARSYGIDTVYGLHGIVHNDDVINFHAERGVRFVDAVEEIPPDQLVVTSAHGIGPEVNQDLENNGATTFDAACILVKATHKFAERARMNGEKVLYICHGKPGEVKKLHDEVLGMVGHLDYQKTEQGVVAAPVERHYLELGEEPDEGLLSVGGIYGIVTQTTLRADKALAYREQIAEYISTIQPDAHVRVTPRGNVCFAVEDRQAGVGQLVELRPRRLVVVTDPESANGRGYVDLARQLTDGDDTVSVHAVANAREASQLGRIDGVTAITASASTPDETTMQVAEALGLQERPEITRGTFSLEDLRPGVIAAKIEQHVRRVA